MANIDEKLAKDKDLTNWCIECDCHSGTHGCLECGAENTQRQCHQRGGLCEECFEGGLEGFDISDDNEYLK